MTRRHYTVLTVSMHYVYNILNNVTVSLSNLASSIKIIGSLSVTDRLGFKANVLSF